MLYIVQTALNFIYTDNGSNTMNIKLDRDKILKHNPQIDVDFLQKSMELQEQLRRNGYKKRGYQILDRDSAIFDEGEKWVGGKSPINLREWIVE